MIDGGASIEQVVVRAAVTIIGVMAYVEVACCATYRVGKEQAAPLSVARQPVLKLSSCISILLDVKLPTSPR